MKIKLYPLCKQADFIRYKHQNFLNNFFYFNITVDLQAVVGNNTHKPQVPSVPQW